MFWNKKAETAKPSGQSTAKRMNQRVTTPLLLQMHATECGAACLGSILAWFGLWIPLTELRSRCEISRDGSSAAGILRAARYYGLECTGRSVSIDALKEMSLPLVLFWEFNHFVILEGFSRDRFFLNDPSTGRRILSDEEFSRSFTGVALEFRTGPKFQPGGNRPNILKQVPLWLGGTKAALACTVLCGVMLSALALVTPALLAVFVDRVSAGAPPWGGLIASAMIATAILCYALTLLRQRWLERLAVRVSVIAGNRCVSQMLRLPVEFFNHRFVGDLTARVLSIDRIAKGISKHFFGLLIEIVMSIIFLTVMLLYTPTLALVTLAIAIINALLAYLVIRIRLDKSLALRREQGLLVGIGTLMLNQTGTLRMTASDDLFFSRWSGHQARELIARQGFAEPGYFNTSLPDFFSILGNAVVLVFGATQVMTGELTLGTLVGIYIIASMFLSPVGRLVEFISDRHALEADMQRLEDITGTGASTATQSPVASSQSVSALDDRLKLTGHVELRDLSFGYNRARPPLIKDFSLQIEPGQRVAVVGSSGSGKSTLTRLLSGLHQPWSGEILFDGHPRHEIPHEILSRSISVVDQRVSLFSASVRDNITLWNPSVPDETVVAAARDACIHDNILCRPLGYETQVNEDGNNFSGGQKQRLEIARALARNPVFLILDEATSSLDAATEELIDGALRRRGISCLIIAHRLSTIRDCNQIIVLDKGTEVQRGTHDELMEDKDGLYRQLVQAG